MNTESDERYYARRVLQELDLAAASDDPTVKAIHLNMAARYATLRERSAPIGNVSGAAPETKPPTAIDDGAPMRKATS